MKNIVLTALIIILSSSAVFCAQSANEPFREMAVSNRNIHILYVRLADNFKRDGNFSTYLRNRRTLYEADRQRLIGILFPYPNPKEAGYNEKYPSYVSEYAFKMNERETANLNDIVQEYCKHNVYKLSKKSPQACSEQVLQSIFANR